MIGTGYPDESRALLQLRRRIRRLPDRHSDARSGQLVDRERFAQLRAYARPRDGGRRDLWLALLGRHGGGWFVRNAAFVPAAARVAQDPRCTLPAVARVQGGTHRVLVARSVESGRADAARQRGGLLPAGARHPPHQPEGDSHVVDCDDARVVGELVGVDELRARGRLLGARLHRIYDVCACILVALGRAVFHAHAQAVRSFLRAVLLRARGGFHVLASVVLRLDGAAAREAASEQRPDDRLAAMVRTHAPGLLLHPDIALNYLSDAVFEAQFVTAADGLARPCVDCSVPGMRTCRRCVFPGRAGLNRPGQSDEQVGAADSSPPCRVRAITALLRAAEALNEHSLRHRTGDLMPQSAALASPPHPHRGAGNDRPGHQPPGVARLAGQLDRKRAARPVSPTPRHGKFPHRPRRTRRVLSPSLGDAAGIPLLHERRVSGRRHADVQADCRSARRPHHRHSSGRDH